MPKQTTLTGRINLTGEWLSENLDHPGSIYITQNGDWIKAHKVYNTGRIPENRFVFFINTVTNQGYGNLVLENNFLETFPITIDIMDSEHIAVLWRSDPKVMIQFRKDD